MKINILKKVRNRFLVNLQATEDTKSTLGAISYQCYDTKTKEIRFLHIEQMILMATDFSNSVIDILVQKAERKTKKEKV